MSKKIVIQADLIGKACKRDILSIVAGVKDIKSMEIDDVKSTLTVVGPVDPVRIVQKLKKNDPPFSAKIISVQDDKPPEKKDPCKEACEKLCKEKCDKACCKECKEKCEKECKEKCEKNCKEWLEKGSCSCCCGGGCTASPGISYTYCPMPSYPYYYYGSSGWPYGYGYGGVYCYEEC
ncbi:hypothetical protein QOZ80_1BG0054260 [Eleusine coracana subsp. coracana]|nr:hypothetical protein QOZ80_1BG0054260 [Eleusine coracana subsp. coracana]